MPERKKKRKSSPSPQFTPQELFFLSLISLLFHLLPCSPGKGCKMDQGMFFLNVFRKVVVVIVVGRVAREVSMS
jgi:hypothetical protein